MAQSAASHADHAGAPRGKARSLRPGRRAPLEEMGDAEIELRSAHVAVRRRPRPRRTVPPRIARGGPGSEDKAAGDAVREVCVAMDGMDLGSTACSASPGPGMHAPVLPPSNRRLPVPAARDEHATAASAPAAHTSGAARPDGRADADDTRSARGAGRRPCPGAVIGPQPPLSPSRGARASPCLPPSFVVFEDPCAVHGLPPNVSCIVTRARGAANDHDDKENTQVARRRA
ncbi:hypothetical protein MSPP1_001011 [Malassezia sp. CBS 17886]|nr:hypothetical protein MSPP1_001011 [Malassezia sp. CBS 17886]